MSKRESPMTLAYWREVGGAIIEEFPLVERTTSQGVRLVDALIVVGEPTVQLKSRSAIDVEGKDIILVQTKAAPLGMSLLGQAYFSMLLANGYLKPRSVRSIALCTATDAALESLAVAHGIEVMVRSAVADR